MASADDHGGTIVLGAGLAALGFASVQPDCVIYEASTHPGGHAHSHEFGGVWFDRGAHICHSLNKEWTSKICVCAGQVNTVERAVVQNTKEGRWFAYPVQNHLCDLPEKERIAALQDFVESQVKYRDETPRNYYEWCLFNYGSHITEHFYRLYTDKYWHVPMEQLSVDWLGGRLLPAMVRNVLAGAIGKQDEKQMVFHRFCYPQSGGYYSFFEKQYKAQDVRYGQRACEVDPKRKIVRFCSGVETGYEKLASSIPLQDLVEMIYDVPSDVRFAASSLKCLKQICVNIVLKSEPEQQAHWFYIYDQDLCAARVSFPMRLGGRGKSALQAEAFFSSELEVDAEAVEERVLDGVVDCLGMESGDIEAVETRMYRHSYVVSDLKRAGAVGCIRAWLASQGITIMGMLGEWRYMWSDKAYESGMAAGRAAVTVPNTLNR